MKQCLVIEFDSATITEEQQAELTVKLKEHLTQLGSQVENSAVIGISYFNILAAISHTDNCLKTGSTREESPLSSVR